MPQFGNLFLKICDFLFQNGDALGIGIETGGSGFGCGPSVANFHIAGEEMGVACFFGAGLRGENLDERRLALHQMLQAGLHGAEIVERMHAFGAGAELAGRLRAAQEQDAENGDFVAIEVEGILEAVLVLGDAAVRGADGADEGLLVQRMERLADGGLVEIHRGFAVRFLVTGIDEGVQGERVIFGGGDFFFDEGAQDAALNCG